MHICCYFRNVNNIVNNTYIHVYNNNNCYGLQIDIQYFDILLKKNNNGLNMKKINANKTRKENSCDNYYARSKISSTH